MRTHPVILPNDGGYRPPRPSAGLGQSGRALWRSVVDAFELRSDELVILESAARLRDEIIILEEALAEAPVTVIGSQGQERVNPLFAEARSHRLAVQRLLASLGLNDADADGSAKSTAGRRLARTRWG